MLDIEQAIVERLQRPRLALPDLGARIGRVDAEIDDFRHLEAPRAHRGEAVVIPIGIDDEIDRDIETERAREFQRFEILPERHALAIGLEPCLVERFEAKKYVFETERAPVAEDILVSQQHIAARLKIILLLDAAFLDRLADRIAVTILDEGDVIDDEDAWLTDRAQILDDVLRIAQPIRAAIESPGAAERAIPRTAAGEFDRGARIKNAEKI